MAHSKDKQNFLTRLVQKKPPFYWWFLLNIGMACIAVFSWFFFVPTFSQPEKTNHYERLIWLGRAPKLPAFEAIHAPEGVLLDPTQAHRMFTSSSLTKEDLEKLNDALLRNYIQGMKFDSFIYYLKGSFQVLEARSLGENDIFQDGIVVKAQSLRSVPNSEKKMPFLVEIEYILPLASKQHLQEFPKGKKFELHLTPHYCSLIHVEKRIAKDGETVVFLSLVPLTVSPPQRSPSGAELWIAAPERLFPKFKLPIFY